jgi:hypothetical protein
VNVSRDFSGQVCGYFTLYRRHFFRRIYGPNFFVEQEDRILYYAEYKEVALQHTCFAETLAVCTAVLSEITVESSPCRVEGWYDARISFHEKFSIYVEVVGDCVTVNLVFRYNVTKTG